MARTNAQLFTSFINGQADQTASMHIELRYDCAVLYSYREAIAVAYPNGAIMIDLDTNYSQTTTQQRSKLLSVLIRHGKDWHNHTRENIRKWAGLDPTTPPTVVRVGRTTHRATTGSQIRLGERL